MITIPFIPFILIVILLVAVVLHESALLSDALNHKITKIKRHKKTKTL